MINIRKYSGCLRLALVAACALLAFGTSAKSCTGIDFSLNMEGIGPSTYTFSGRTMEFGPDVTSWKLLYMPRGAEYKSCEISKLKTCVQYSTDTIHVNGYAWTTQHSYVGFTPMKPLKDASSPTGTLEYTLTEINDGINDQGVYCGGFYHMGTESYSTESYIDGQHNVSDMDFIAWVLGQFGSVADLRTALATPGSVYVRQFDVSLFGKPITNPKKFPQLHYKVVDKTGDAIVIEFVNGAPKVFDSIGVITNNPTYDWQLTNLRNYVGLQDENHESATFLKKPYDQVSNGTGAIGLPGDFTSPSRFVRATFLLNATLANNTIRTPEEAVLRAFRVLNQFDIPEGSVVEISTPTATSIEKSTPTEKITMEATSWTSMADLRNLRYYYHTMYSRTIRMISLEDIDKHTPMVEHPQPRTIELPSNELILDATDKFLLK